MTQQAKEQDKLREAFVQTAMHEWKWPKEFFWQHSETKEYTREPAIYAWRAWQAASAQAVPEFSHAAKRKLEYLLERGAKITGYAFQKADGRHGAIDCGGFVQWRTDEKAAPVDAKQAVQMPEPVGVVTNTVPREPGWKTSFVPPAGTKLYTEQQVRAMLAASSNSVESHQIKTTAPAAPVLQPRYRLLARGVDVIEAADEFLLGDSVTWAVDPKGVFVGAIYKGDTLLPARRRIDSITGAPNAD